MSLALPSWSAAVGRSGTAARPPLFLLLGLALLHFWRWGYAYGNSDQDELLPQVLHRLEPALFARDWFVLSQADGVTVRTVFVELLRLLGLVVPLPVAVGLLHFGVLVAVGWGVYRLGYALVPDRLGASLGAFLAVVLLPHWTLGGNRLTYAQVAPENLAWALALPAVWLFLHRRRLAAAVLLGLTAWMQLLVGAQTAAVLAAVALWEAGWERSVRGAGRAVLFGLVAAAVAAPVALPAVLAPPMEGPTVPGVTAFHALARLRVPHHYLPSAFGVAAYVRFGLIAVAGLAALWALRRGGRLRHGRFVVRFLAVVALCGVVAAVFTEGVPVLFVAQLQLFKLTVWATTLLTLLVGAWVAGALPARLRALGEGALARPRLGLAVVAVAALGTAAAVGAGFGPAASRYVPGQYAASDLARAEAWVRARTPVDALFLIPPSNTTFRTHARRSVVVNFKPTPYQRGGILVWLHRMLAVAPMPVPERGGFPFQEALDAAYAANDAGDWQRLARRFGADWALVDAARTASPPPGPPAFRAGDWAVYRLRSAE
ncbi:MAG TPA: DUF6798 domain-containing protein [Rubricoccaceae bacterium]|nr:DUF6798 domain-containing protein [Rubricoccaceae bacterium]